MPGPYPSLFVTNIVFTSMPLNLEYEPIGADAAEEMMFHIIPRQPFAIFTAVSRGRAHYKKPQFQTPTQ